MYPLIMAASDERAWAWARHVPQSPGVFGELGRIHGLDVEATLVVPELAPVVLPALEAGRPPEQGIARGLQEALPADDPLALVAVVRPSDERLEDRCMCLLSLHEEGVTVGALEQGDEAAGADAAGPDDLEGHVRDQCSMRSR
jgi:hypothetical protein